ncbi:hypothetical protein [Paenibacillus glacialis]|uniref:hypothetical protein n=1 Tax=Paenibacillus glacialis TaxID=494026 RepID=UPI001B80C2F9|nr:hypothetical protein [Paenibacillus glacialis]
MFTHRGASPLDPQKLEVNSGWIFSCKEVDSADTSAPTNRIAAAHFRSLKSVGRREHGTVIGNQRKY